MRTTKLAHAWQCACTTLIAYTATQVATSRPSACRVTTCVPNDEGNGTDNVTLFDDHAVEPAPSETFQEWVGRPMVIISNTSDSSEGGAHWFTVAMHLVPDDC